MTGLAFERTGGPVVVISGLNGGSGATTLAVALAAQAARESTAPVLLTEHHHAGGAIAAMTATQSPLGLWPLAACMADDQAPESAVAEPEPGLRLIAALATHAVGAVRDEALDALISEARGAHGLVVIDAGPAICLPAALTRHATHLVWTMAATVVGAACAEAMLGGSALPRPGAQREVCVALAPPAGAVRVRTLRRIARTRCDRLVLTPFAPGDPAALQRALTALALTLHRAP